MEDITESSAEGDDRKIEEVTAPAPQNGAKKAVDISEMNSMSALDIDGQAEERKRKKDKIVSLLRTIDNGTYQFSLNRQRIVLDDEELEEPKGPVEKHIISTKTLIILVFLFAGAGIGVKFLYNMQERRIRAACELLQKGQPLPDAPNEVRIPDVDSLYKLIEVCEQNHDIDITYGCAAKGVLHTAGLNHEPSEIPETLRAEALRVAEEVQCNL